MSTFAIIVYRVYNEGILDESREMYEKITIGCFGCINGKILRKERAKKIIADNKMVLAEESQFGRAYELPGKSLKKQFKKYGFCYTEEPEEYISMESLV